jgi:hypothetical protein
MIADLIRYLSTHHSHALSFLPCLIESRSPMYDIAFYLQLLYYLLYVVKRPSSHSFNL